MSNCKTYNKQTSLEDTAHFSHYLSLRRSTLHELSFRYLTTIRHFLFGPEHSECRCLTRKFSQKREGRGGERERRGGGRGRTEKERRAEQSMGAWSRRDARAGASVVGGKREFALSHPRIYPTPSSQGAGLRYHPCRPAPRPSVFSPAFFSPIGRPSRRPAGDAPFADRTRVGVRVLGATSSCSTPFAVSARFRDRDSRGTIDRAPPPLPHVVSFPGVISLVHAKLRIGRAKRLYTLGFKVFVYNCYERRAARQLEPNDSEQFERLGLQLSSRSSLAIYRPNCPSKDHTPIHIITL